MRGATCHEGYTQMSRRAGEMVGAGGGQAVINKWQVEMKRDFGS